MAGGNYEAISLFCSICVIFCLQGKYFMCYLMIPNLNLERKEFYYFLGTNLYNICIFLLCCQVFFHTLVLTYDLDTPQFLMLMGLVVYFANGCHRVSKCISYYTLWETFPKDIFQFNLFLSLYFKNKNSKMAAMVSTW